MTKKDYIAIAEVMAKQKYVFDKDVSVDKYLIFRSICMDWCEVLQADNSLFDRDRFLTACGFTE